MRLPRRGPFLDRLNGVFSAAGQPKSNCVINWTPDLSLMWVPTASIRVSGNVVRTVHWPKIPVVCHDLFFLELAENIHERPCGLVPVTQKSSPKLLGTQHNPNSTARVSSTRCVGFFR